MLGRPDAYRGKGQRYWPVGREDPDNPSTGEIGPRGVFYQPARIKARKLLGMTDDDIEQEYQEWRAKITLPGDELR